MPIPKGYIPKHKFWKNGRVIRGVEYNTQTQRTKEVIDDLIDEWHEGDSELPLHEFLGWTEEEYKAWVEFGQLPERKI